VPVTEGRHLDDLALDQLDTLVLAEDAGLSHPVILLHGEEPARELDVDSHRQPPEPVSQSHLPACSSARSGTI
jgi:hypothetical protein